MPLLEKITKEELKKFMESKAWSVFIEEIDNQCSMLTEEIMSKPDLSYVQITYVKGIYKGLQLIKTTPESMESVIMLELANLSEKGKK